MSRYSIGLDIGIASVGWSVIDTQNNGRIDDLGVRLFTARNSDNNSERRDARGARRLTRRRKVRLKDAKKHLKAYGFDKESQLDHVDPYGLRVKGLEDQLSKGEIYKVVLHILKKRGISYLSDELEESSGSSTEHSQQVEKNARLLQDKTPGQIQYERLHENGRVRTGDNANNEYQLNVFTTDAYARELYSILNKQDEFYDEIDDDFIHYLTDPENKSGLIYRKRPYYHGPGNEHNNSPYGRWANYAEDGKPADNIFDQLIGKDITGNIRASTNSITAQKYNLLNDMNNLVLPREDAKFTTEEKEDLLNYLLNEDVSRFGVSQFVKFFDYKVEDIRGWRLNSKDKPEMHLLDTYRKWKGIFAEYDIDITDVSDKDLDKIAFVTTLNTDKEAIVETLNNDSDKLDPKVFDLVTNEFSRLRQKGSNKSWHSFSLPTMHKLIPEMIHTSKEQNTLLEEFGYKVDFRNQYADRNTLPSNKILEEIYNPTVSRSVRQTINVFNSLVKRYGKENIAHVIVEMPRDKNEDDQKKTIREIQKANKNRHEKSEEYFLEKSGWPKEKFEAKMSSSRFAKKLSYYYEQDGICAYSGKAIAPDDLLSEKTEIDHIIPLSISLDDSINNKVLVTSAANQAKGQRSPLQAFDEGAAMGQSKEEYIAWVNSRKFKKYKRLNLLNDENIFDPEVRQKFVNRNLNDTRYSSRLVLNALQSFFGKTDTTVKVINGAYTHTVRKKWGSNLEKTRETYHHHAVDATICAVSPYIHEVRFEYHVDDDGKAYMVDVEDGELIPYHEYKKMNLADRRNYYCEWENFPSRLIPSEIHPKIKFSHQVDRKPNRKISDATIYSTRQQTTTTKSGKEKTEEYIIGKTGDIYTVDGYKSYVKNKDKLLMKEHDIQSFEKLEAIAEKYPKTQEIVNASGKKKTVDVSPFKLYCEDNEVPGIQKYSKKGNGPLLKNLKYYDKKLGSHINITKDTQGNSIDTTKNDKKTVLLSLKPWRTDVYYNPEEGSYHLLGINYNHLKFVEGDYGIPYQVYEDLKADQGIKDNWQFKFSLYRNDRIQVKQDGLVDEGRYGSYNLTGKNYFEMKPIDKNKWDSNQLTKVFGNISKSGQFIKGLKPEMSIVKINTDYLGTPYYVSQEELKNIIK